MRLMHVHVHVHVENVNTLARACGPACARALVAVLQSDRENVAGDHPTLHRNHFLPSLPSAAFHWRVRMRLGHIHAVFSSMEPASKTL